MYKCVLRHNLYLCILQPISRYACTAVLSKINEYACTCSGDRMSCPTDLAISHPRKVSPRV